MPLYHNYGEAYMDVLGPRSARREDQDHRPPASPDLEDRIKAYREARYAAIEEEAVRIGQEEAALRALDRALDEAAAVLFGAAGPEERRRVLQALGESQAVVRLGNDATRLRALDESEARAVRERQKASSPMTGPLDLNSEEELAAHRDLEKKRLVSNWLSTHRGEGAAALRDLDKDARGGSDVSVGAGPGGAESSPMTAGPFKVLRDNFRWSLAWVEPGGLRIQGRGGMKSAQFIPRAAIQSVQWRPWTGEVHIATSATPSGSAPLSGLPRSFNAQKELVKLGGRDARALYDALVTFPEAVGTPGDG